MLFSFLLWCSVENTTFIPCISKWYRCCPFKSNSRFRGANIYVLLYDLVFDFSLLLPGDSNYFWNQEGICLCSKEDRWDSTYYKFYEFVFYLNLQFLIMFCFEGIWLWSHPVGRWFNKIFVSSDGSWWYKRSWYGGSNLSLLLSCFVLNENYLLLLQTVSSADVLERVSPECCKIFIF